MLAQLELTVTFNLNSVYHVQLIAALVSPSYSVQVVLPTITLVLLYTLAHFHAQILHTLIPILLALFADHLAALALTLPSASVVKAICLFTTLESVYFLVLQVHLSSLTQQQISSTVLLVVPIAQYVFLHNYAYLA